jgi:hypothetical protein
MHTISVRARDTSGNITRGTIRFDVIELAFDREVLWVDDSFDLTYPNDMQQDAFWRGLFDDYAAHSNLDPTDFDEIHVHGSGDLEILEPSAVKLSDLGRHKLVIWDNRANGYNGISSLLRSATLSRNLEAYLRAGGKLWVEGRLTVAAMVRSANGVNADLEYPKVDLRPGDFAWDYLKLQSTRIDSDKGNRQQHTLVRVHPSPGHPEIYPFMEYAPDKLNIAQKGIPYCEAIFDPMFMESSPSFRGDVDSLYTYGAAAEILGGSSIFQDRLCAIRWHDPDLAREQGRTQWFGFPMYYFQDDQAKETFRRSVDWFREEFRPPPEGRD